MSRQTGVCKWFNNQKGFGFIKVDGTNQDIFVHYKSIEDNGFKSLAENDRVEFEIEENAKGPRAVHVTKI